MSSDEVKLLRTPSGRVWYLAEHEAWLEQRGYLDPSGPRADDPTRCVFYRTRHRENAVRDDGPGGMRIFDKRLREISVGDLLQTSLAARRMTTPIAQEWNMLWRARKAGLIVPRPLAFGEVRRGPLPTSSFLVVENMEGTSLDQLLLRPEALGRERTNLVADAIAHAVGWMHAAGLRFPSLFAKHIYVIGIDGALPRVGFIDLASMSQHRAVSPRERARDLAALAATLPRSRVSAALRWRFLRTYLAASAGLRWPPRIAWSTISRRVEWFYRHRGKRTHACPMPDRDGLEVAAGRGIHAIPSRIGCIALHAPSLDQATWPRGTWQSFDMLAVRRGSQYETRILWTAYRLMRQFGLAAPAPVAVKLAGDSSWLALEARVHDDHPPIADALAAAPLTADAERRLGDLLVGLFAAGVVPGPHVFAHIRMDPRGIPSLHHRAAVHVPRRMHSWNAVRAARRLVSALKLLPLDKACRDRIRRRIVHEGVSAALGRYETYAAPLP